MNRLSSLTALLLLSACTGSGNQDESSAASPEALVSLATATNGAVATTTSIYGAVEMGASAQYTLAAPVEATVVSVPAPVGTHVIRGSLVVALRPAPTTSAQIAKAASDAKAAEQALARAERLRADGLASDADVETARQTLAASRATSQALAQQTRALSLRSPGEGYVSAVAVNPGDLVASGANVATISRTGALRARFGVDPALINQLSPGQTIRVKRSGGGASFDMLILSVDPSIDPQTRLAALFGRIPASLALGPGQPLTGTAILSRSAGAVTIPYAALLDDGGQPYVYVVSGGVAHRHDVVTGATSGKLVAIEKGVAAGDKVVTAGGTAVEDGMKVRTK